MKAAMYKLSRTASNIKDFVWKAVPPDIDKIKISIITQRCSRKGLAIYTDASGSSQSQGNESERILSVYFMEDSDVLIVFYRDERTREAIEQAGYKFVRSLNKDEIAAYSKD